MNDLNEEELQGLSFLEFLIYMRAYAQISIQFQAKSHGAFIIAREIMAYIINRYRKENISAGDNNPAQDMAGHNFLLDAQILSRYKDCKRDIDRREVIVEFKKELDYDLACLIRALERARKSRLQYSGAEE